MPLSVFVLHSDCFLVFTQESIVDLKRRYVNLSRLGGSFRRYAIRNERWDSQFTTASLLGNTGRLAVGTINESVTIDGLSGLPGKQNHETSHVMLGAGGFLRPNVIDVDGEVRRVKHVHRR